MQGNICRLKAVILRLFLQISIGLQQRKFEYNKKIIKGNTSNVIFRWPQAILYICQTIFKSVEIWMYGNRENNLAIFGNGRRWWYASDTDFHYSQIWMQLLGFEMIICFNVIFYPHQPNNENVLLQVIIYISCEKDSAIIAKHILAFWSSIFNEP